MTMESVKDILASLVKKETRPLDWTETALDAVKRADKEIGAFLVVDEEGARARATSLETALQTTAADASAKPTSAAMTLFGVPYAAKDNLCTEGLRSTAASRILENYVPPYSATVVHKLANAGGVLIGKTNLDEFAMGSSTENSAFQKTRNPYGLDFVPGGSSGGSAAAVAAGMVPFALGSDTGGSIRQPASFCGVVGMKPTYGRVSRFGLMAFASSLDQIGPFTQTVEDAALVLQAISGHDDYDSTSAPVEVPDYVEELKKDIKGLRIGVLRGLDGTGVDDGVQEAVQKAVQVLQNAGAEVVEIELPHMQYAVATYYLLAPAEASSNLSRYDGVRFGRRASGETLLEMYERSRSEGFGTEVKRRIIIGTYALSSGYYDAYYKRAQQMRTLITRDFDAAFQSCDVIVSPTAPTTAFRFGEKSADPLQMYMSDIFTIPANLAGLPGISVPCGFADGMPVGLQILGPAFADGTVLRVAHAYEKLRGFSMPAPRLEGVR